MAHTNASDQRQYRYKLHLTVDQTDAARPSILVSRHKLLEADSLQSPELGALADYCRDHAGMTEKDRYVLAFSLQTARQILGRAVQVSSSLDDLKACLDHIGREVLA